MSDSFVHSLYVALEESRADAMEGWDVGQKKLLEKNIVVPPSSEMNVPFTVALFLNTGVLSCEEGNRIG